MLLLLQAVHPIKLYSILSQMYVMLGHMSNSRDFNTVFCPMFVQYFRLVITMLLYAFTKLSVFLFSHVILIILHIVGRNFAGSNNKTIWELLLQFSEFHLCLYSCVWYKLFNFIVCVFLSCIFLTLTLKGQGSWLRAEMLDTEWAVQYFVERAGEI